MSVYEIDPLRDPRWEELVGQHPEASVFHSREWLASLQQVYGYEPIAVSTCPPNSPLDNGLLFCRVKSWLTGARLVSLPFSDHCQPLVGGPAQLDSLLQYFRREVDEGKWKYLEIRPTAAQTAKLGQSASYYFHRLDLTAGAEQLFRGFHKDCIQRKVRRAERESLQYEEGNSPDLLKQFYELVLMTRRRQHLPPQPMAWFRCLAANFGEKLKIRIASKDGRPVASILTISYKHTLTYKYGCSNAAFNNLGGTPFLFWRAVQDAKENQLVAFDLGRSDMDNPGLAAFKEHLGAARSLLTYWRYPEPAPARESAWKMRLVGRLVSAAPDASLAAAARLLYRHIG